MARLSRLALGSAFVAAGVLHFVIPDVYAAIVPRWLPVPRALVAVSGVFEIAGGLGVLSPWPRVRAAAGVGLALLLVAVYPANVQMALDGTAGPAWALWGRLPLQGALVAWALRSSGALGYGVRSNVPGQASSASATS